MIEIPGFDGYFYDGYEVYSTKGKGKPRAISGHGHTTPNGTEVFKYQLYANAKKKSITLDKIKKLCNEQ